MIKKNSINIWWHLHRLVRNMLHRQAWYHKHGEEKR